MPTAPKPEPKNKRRNASKRGKGFETRVAAEFDEAWKIVAETMDLPDELIGTIERRKKDPTLGYAVNVDDIAGPELFPFVIECKKRGDLPKTLEKWREQNAGYNTHLYGDSKINVLTLGDTNGSNEQRRVYMSMEDFLRVWAEGWIWQYERILEMRKVAAPIVASLMFSAIEGETQEMQRKDTEDFLRAFGGIEFEPENDTRAGERKAT